MSKVSVCWVWVHRLKVQREQKSALNNIKRQKNLMLLSTVHRSKNMWHLGYRKRWTDANNLVIGTHWGSALHLARSVVGVESKIILRQSAS